MDLKSVIRTIPDYPKPGIMFRDVTTLIENADALKEACKQLADEYRDAGISKVAGIEARGFIFGVGVALELGAGFIPLRKPGKLPAQTISESYSLEYGEDELHMHVGTVAEGEKVLLIDDLIATGGTAAAGLKLLRRSNANVVAAAFVVDLPELGGADKLRAEGVDVFALLDFEGH
jgi:adenine phosphoribosyltransferase